MLLILTALIDERRITDGRVDLGVGTLYGALDRLAAEGLVEQHRDEVESGRLRWYCRLTNTGVGVVAAEASRMAASAAVAMERLKKFAAPAGNAGLGEIGGTA